MGSVLLPLPQGRILGGGLPCAHSILHLAAQILKALGGQLASAAVCGAVAVWKVFLPSVRWDNPIYVHIVRSTWSQSHSGQSNQLQSRPCHGLFMALW